MFGFVFGYIRSRHTLPSIGYLCSHTLHRTTSIVCAPSACLLKHSLPNQIRADGIARPGLGLKLAKILEHLSVVRPINRLKSHSDQRFNERHAFAQRASSAMSRLAGSRAWREAGKLFTSDYVQMILQYRFRRPPLYTKPQTMRWSPS